MAGKRSESNKIERERRRIRALQLRGRALSYRDIGDELGVSHETARQDVKRALSELVEQRFDEAEQFRALEMHRLEMAMRAIEDKVRDGELKAVDRWVKLSESLRDLLGLDAPKRREVQAQLSGDEKADQISSILDIPIDEDGND